MNRVLSVFRQSLPLLFLPVAWLGDTSWSLAALPAVVAVFLVGDAALGRGDDVSISLPASRRCDRIPRLVACLQLGAIVLAILSASDVAVSTVGFVALVLATGVTSGVFGMLSAHELMHSRRPFDRALGLAMLAGVSYMHFRIAHLRGHHRLAATPDDPATARRGETLYRFVLRSVIGQYRQCWQFERRRAKAGQRRSAGNRMVTYLAVTAAIHAAAMVLAGLRGVILLALQSLLAIFILEAFNYVVHYGLERRRQTDGRYEPLAAAHSWNTTRRFTNWALFNAGNHSHHHAAPALTFGRLRVVDDAPELPAGYAGCMLLALVPPWWRRVMEQRLPTSGRAIPEHRPGGIDSSVKKMNSII